MVTSTGLPDAMRYDRQKEIETIPARRQFTLKNKGFYGM
jgi:hypothetical protein